MSPYASHGPLPRDPVPGSPEWDLLARNLMNRRERLERLNALAARLPVEIADERFAVRDLELRLGLPPTYPAPPAKESP